MFDFGPSPFGNKVLQVLLDQIITSCSLIHSIFPLRLIAARSNALQPPGPAFAGAFFSSRTRLHKPDVARRAESSCKAGVPHWLRAGSTKPSAAVSKEA